jgi:hypothetical protein
VNCKAAREQLPDQALGTIPEPEAAELRRHLRGCGACRTESALLDQGVRMFSSAAHAIEPPLDLRRRVLGALEEEWAEAAPPAGSWRDRPSLLRLTLAASVVALVGLLTWALVAQTAASRNAEDASEYRDVLTILGGTDMRASPLRSSIEGVEGSVILYDSSVNQSWVGVFLRAPGYGRPIDLYLVGPGGDEIEFPFRIDEYDERGRAVAWLDTSRDISEFTQVRLVGDDGKVVASAIVRPGVM